MSNQKKIYFASDFHLGIDALDSSIDRERKIVAWLDDISHDAAAIYLVGDLFDFWFEYRSVVPKGFFRFLAKLDQISQKGIELHLFTGNHDMWMFGYLEKEIGLIIHRRPLIKKINNKTFFIAHGDGLGPGDYTYKLLKKVFSSKICQFLFARLHPNLSFRIAQAWSQSSRNAHDPHDGFDPDSEWLIAYSYAQLKMQQIDYFIFGHRHIPINYILNDNSRYINLGDWLYHYSYAVYDGLDIQIKKYGYASED